MLIVTCVKWGKMYGPEYVNRLYSMARRHLRIPFRFDCFTDDVADIDLDVVCRVLPRNLHGWWNKLSLFGGDTFLRGTRVLYFDLDTVILGDITPLAECASEFAILRDFYRPRGLGSGVMLWEAGRMDDIWNGFVADGCPDLPGGDQSYIEVAAHRRWGRRIPRECILQDLYPGALVSYKAHCGDGPPPGASVVCFHGQPKPHNCGADWIARHWRSESDQRSSAA